MCLISLPPTPFLLVILFHLPQPLLGRLLARRVPLPGLLRSLERVRLRGGMFEMRSVTWRASLASSLLMCPGTPLVNRGVHTYPVSYTHLRAHETPEHLVCRLLLEK